MARSSIASSLTRATTSCTPSALRRVTTRANSWLVGRSASARACAGRSARAPRLGLVSGGHQPLEPPLGILKELLEAAKIDLAALGMAQGRRELGQARLVIVDAEDQLDDRGHGREGLGLYPSLL